MKAAQLQALALAAPGIRHPWRMAKRTAGFNKTVAGQLQIKKAGIRLLKEQA